MRDHAHLVAGEGGHGTPCFCIYAVTTWACSDTGVVFECSRVHSRGACTTYYDYSRPLTGRPVPSSTTRHYPQPAARRHCTGVVFECSRVHSRGASTTYYDYSRPLTGRLVPSSTTRHYPQPAARRTVPSSAPTPRPFCASPGRPRHTGPPGSAPTADRVVQACGPRAACTRGC